TRDRGDPGRQVQGRDRFAADHPRRQFDRHPPYRRGHPLRRQPRRHQGRQADRGERQAHCRQRQPDLRRRLRRDGGQRARPEVARRQAAGAHPSHDHDGRRSRDHAGCAPPRHQAGAGEGRHVDQRHRPVRGQRGLRGRACRVAADHRRRSGTAERQRRRDRARPSARRLRHQADDHAGQCAQAEQQALRPADHVRRRRHGERDDRRTSLKTRKTNDDWRAGSALPARHFHIEEPPMTHPSIHARTYPNKIAYQMAATGKSITYRELDELSNQGAHLFRSLGLKAGDHIALLMENRLAFMEICWAAQRAGLYYTAISRYLTQDEIAYIVKDCGAKVFITTPKCAEQVRGLVGQVGGPLLYMLDEPEPGFRSFDREAAEQSAMPIPDEVAGYDMLYSSGTTGRPKGIKKEFENNPIDVPNAFLKILCADMCGMSSDSIYLSPAPLYHAAPLRFNMMAITLGGTSVIMEHFDAEEFLKLVEKYKATQSQLVPTMFVRMLKLPDEVR